MQRKALILAAGLGRRLLPLTSKKPKALVEWEGVTLMEHAVEKLKQHGFNFIVINIHHFADQIIDFVKSRNNFGIDIRFSDERKKLLDTGGGIKHAASFFGNDPFLVYNVDIMSSIDLDALMAYHIEKSPLATLAVKERITSRSLLTGKDRRLEGWRDNRTGEQIMVRDDSTTLSMLAFSGIHVIDPAIFKLLGSEKCFSIIDRYLDLAKEYKISLYLHNHDSWMDLGKLESYQ